MKLRMSVRGVVDGALREVNATLIVTDPEQITAMLESKMAIPADSAEAEAYRATLPVARTWVSGWRR